MDQISFNDWSERVDHFSSTADSVWLPAYGFPNHSTTEDSLFLATAVVSDGADDGANVSNCSSAAFLVLETIFEEESDDLAGEDTSDSDTENDDVTSVIHISPDDSESERDVEVPKKRRRRELLPASLRARLLSDEEESSLSRSSSLLQFESLEQEMEEEAEESGPLPVFRTSATHRPFLTESEPPSFSSFSFDSLEQSVVKDSLEESSASDSSSDSETYFLDRHKASNLRQSRLRSYRSFDSLLHAVRPAKLCEPSGEESDLVPDLRPRVPSTLRSSENLSEDSGFGETKLSPPTPAAAEGRVLFNDDLEEMEIEWPRSTPRAAREITSQQPDLIHNLAWVRGGVDLIPSTRVRAEVHREQDDARPKIVETVVKKSPEKFTTIKIVSVKIENLNCKPSQSETGNEDLKSGITDLVTSSRPVVSDPPELTTSDLPQLTSSDPPELITSDPLELTTSDPLELTTSDPLELTTLKSDPPEVTKNNSDPRKLTTSDPPELTTLKSDPHELVTASEPPELNELSINICAPASSVYNSAPSLLLANMAARKLDPPTEITEEVIQKKVQVGGIPLSPESSPKSKSTKFGSFFQRFSFRKSKKSKSRSEESLENEALDSVRKVAEELANLEQPAAGPAKSRLFGVVGKRREADTAQAPRDDGQSWHQKIDSNVSRNNGCGAKASSLVNLGMMLNVVEIDLEHDYEADKGTLGPAQPPEPRAKSMEFLLDEENKAAVQPPENELRKVSERQLSEHELRVQRSLQRLNVPDWYKNSAQHTPTSGSFLLKRSGSGTKPGGWQGLSSKTTSLSSLQQSPCPRSKHRTEASPSPVVSPSPQERLSFSYAPFSRWSTSRLHSGPTSANTSPSGSTRSSFHYRQPYLGWRSQEKLLSSTPSHYRTPAERLAANMVTKPPLPPAVSVQPPPSPQQAEMNEQVRSSIKEVTSAIVHYVTEKNLSPANTARPADISDRSPSPRGSKSRVWVESSFVGSRPLDSPQTPHIGDSESTNGYPAEKSGFIDIRRGPLHPSGELLLA